MVFIFPLIMVEGRRIVATPTKSSDPRKLLIEIEDFWNNGVLASLAYTLAEKLKLTDPF